MSDTRVVRSVLRWLAMAVAIAAIVDPAFTSARNAKVTVAVVTSDSRDAESEALAARIRKSLAGSMTVISAPFWPTAATVVVGDRLTAAVMTSGGPVFAVVQGADEPRVAIETMDLPRRATIDASVPVAAGVRFAGAAGRTVEVTLSAGGLVVDRVTRQVRSADERIDVTLNAVPGDTGVLPLRVEARVAGGSTGGASADAAVDVGANRHSVLFYDARLSFASTFVRRALERDARFAVTARSITSRAVSVDAGAPPARLDDAASLAQFDVVVVGAPGALNEAAVAGLDAYMRNRGGSVVLLMDERQAGPFERLTGARDWRAATGQVAGVKNAAGAQSLRGTSFAWPVSLPAGATAVAVGDSSRPVIWKSPVGAGQVIVSGALDAWRYRDAGSSAFERFWRDQIAEAAARAPESISMHAPSAAAPGDRVTLGVDLRDVALRGRGGVAAARVSVGATLVPIGARDGDAVRSELRLIPTGSVGHFEATFRAPAAGTYRIEVESGAGRVTAPLDVRRDVLGPAGGDRAALDAWVAATGGSVIPAGEVGRLADAIRAAAVIAARPVPWHPMRSAWWMALFALALSAEWWLRRRNGLA